MHRFHPQIITLSYNNNNNLSTSQSLPPSSQSLPPTNVRFNHHLKHKYCIHSISQPGLNNDFNQQSMNQPFMNQPLQHQNTQNLNIPLINQREIQRNASIEFNDILLHMHKLRNDCMNKIYNNQQIIQFCQQIQHILDIDQRYATQFISNRTMTEFLGNLQKLYIGDDNTTYHIKSAMIAIDRAIDTLRVVNNMNNMGYNMNNNNNNNTNNIGGYNRIIITTIIIRIIRIT